jgi:ribosomal-protein-alanine N-acetyltransferase
MEQIPNDAARWTPRLLLRQPIADDVGVILRLHQDPLAIAHNPGDALEDEVAAQDLLQRWMQHWKQYAIGYWALSWRSDPAVLGFCGVKVMALHGHAVSNLLYRLDPRVWGCGVATEAASAVVGEALRHRPDDPVIARVRPANHASARVALKAGLTRAAELDTPGEDGLDHIYASPGWAVT